MPDQPQQPQPPVVVVQQDTSGRIVEAAKTVAGFSPQAMQNLMLAALFGIVSLLIYLERIDRRESDARERSDRAEQFQMVLRSGESQGELNRQAIMTLGMEVGQLRHAVTKLDTSVGEFRRTVGGKDPEGEETFAPMPRVKGAPPTPKTS
jgi:hypothetical protein